MSAGFTAQAFDSSPPLVCDEPAASYERASDEHGRLGISGATNRLRIGDKIRLVPGHCDPTIKLEAVNAATRISDLAVPPSNRLEKLRGDLEGFYSVRINDQWRVIFRWSGGDADEVRIVDYH
jgi:proteic killer suppression protein